MTTKATPVRDSLIYVGSAILNASIPFLLLPFLSRALGTAEYGVIGTFSAMVQAAAVFVGLSTHGYLSVRYFEAPAAQFARAVGGCVVLAGGTTILLVGVLFGFGSRIEQVSGVGVEWVWTVAFCALGQFLLQVLLGNLRVRRDPVRFGMVQIGATALNFAGTLVLVFLLAWGWEGRAVAQLAATLGVAVVGLGTEWRKGYLRFGGFHQHLRPAVMFGIFLVPHALATVAMGGADRFFLTAQLGTAAAGQYFAAFQVCSGLTLVFSAVNQAWAPTVYEVLSDGSMEQRRYLIIHSAWLLAAAVIGVLCVGLAGPLLLRILAGQDFLISGLAIWLLAAAAGFRAAYFVVTNYLFFAKKTGLLSTATVLSAILQVILLSLLLPEAGLEGAAFAALAATGVHFACVAFFSFRIVPLPWTDVLAGMRHSRGEPSDR